MDGSLIVGISELVSLPLLVIITGVVGAMHLRHQSKCDDRWRKNYQRIEELNRELDDRLDRFRMEIFRRMDEIKDGVSENRESVARIEGKIGK